MLESLAGKWWILALRGIAGILFGLMAFTIPGITLVYLVLLFGAYAFLDGLLNVAVSIRSLRHNWMLLLEGIAGIVAGVLTFAVPAMTAWVLLYVIAFWALVTGMLEIATGVRLRKVIHREWLLIAMGVLSLVFGILVLMAPSAAALTIVLWIGSYAFVFGVIMLALAFRLRSDHRPLSSIHALPRHS
jgi:uncharacterized membrane protein HdeD (DUF308 family)